MRCLLTLLVLSIASASSAAAHDDLERQIANASAELERAPGNESFRILRSDLYRRHGQWSEAFADLAAVVENRESDVFAQARARLFLDMGYPRAAQTVIEARLRTHPESGPLRLLRSEALAARGESTAAVAELDRFLATSEAPEPDHFLARARLVAGAQPDRAAAERALSGLDEGLERLGPLPSLQLVAIDLELARGTPERALERLDALAAGSDRKESWLVRRADILATTGRAQEARAAYEDALRAIRRLRPKQRGTARIRSLEHHVLERLACASPTESPTPSPGTTP